MKKLCFSSSGGSPSAAKSKKKRACAPDGNKTVKNVASARSGSTFYQFLGEIREPRGCHHWPFFHVFSTLAPFKVLPGTLPGRSWDLIFTYFGMISINCLSIVRDFCAAMDRIFARCLADLLSAFLVLCGVWCVLCVVCSVWCGVLRRSLINYIPKRGSCCFHSAARIPYTMLTHAYTHCFVHLFRTPSGSAAPAARPLQYNII